MNANRFRFRAWIPKEHWIAKNEGEGMLYDWQDAIYQEFECFSPDPSGGIVVMQSTGLCDKNGKEIFEGDILGERDYIDGVVVFDKIGYDGAWNGLTGFALDKWNIDRNDEIPFYELDYHFDPTILVVMGNIYENPELLETK